MQTAVMDKFADPTMELHNKIGLAYGMLIYWNYCYYCHRAAGTSCWHAAWCLPWYASSRGTHHMTG